MRQYSSSSSRGSVTQSRARWAEACGCRLKTRCRTGLAAAAGGVGTAREWPRIGRSAPTGNTGATVISCYQQQRQQQRRRHLAFSRCLGDDQRWIRSVSTCRQTKKLSFSDDEHTHCGKECLSCTIIADLLVEYHANGDWQWVMTCDMRQVQIWPAELWRQLHGVSCSTTTGGSWFQSLTVLTANE